MRRSNSVTPLISTKKNVFISRVQETVLGKTKGVLITTFQGCPYRSTVPHYFCFYSGRDIDGISLLTYYA